MFTLFEHTADIGIRVRASDLETLLADAARGLFAVLVANPEAIRDAQRVEFSIPGERYDELLFDWLAELLYTFATRKLLFARFEVRLEPGGLRAAAWGEPMDRARHQMDMEVKAITYHGLKVEPDGEGWLAEVIVDI